MSGALPRVKCHGKSLEALSGDPRSAFWQAIEPFRLRENITGELPSQETLVRVAWDRQEWRLLFEAADAHPWATVTERDGPLWTEEVVEVFFDPFGDLESYFEVEINPLGTVTDLVLRRTASGWRKDFAWNVEGLGAVVQHTAAGWSAELSIPFESLGPELQPKAGRSEWRANFLRIDRPGGPGIGKELSAWSPTHGPTFHRAAVFGTVEFVAE